MAKRRVARFVTHPFIILSLSWSLVSGCGPSVQQLNPQIALTDTILLLPIKSNEVLALDRAQLIQESFERGFGSQGFLVLSRDSISNRCKGQDCSRKETLGSLFPTATIAEVTIESTRQTNLIAAFYNNIVGQLSLFSAQNQPIVTIGHTESERGGVLFNSGQILEGIQATATDLSADSFPVLAERFSRKIVSEVPRSNIDRKKISSPSFNSVQVTPKGFLVQICATVEQAAQVFLLNGGRKTRLSRVRDNHFCAVLPSKLLTADRGTKRIIATNQYGIEESKDFAVLSMSTCSLTGNIFFDRATGSIQCKQECPPSCLKEQIVVYRGGTSDTPFTEFGNLQNGKIKLPAGAEDLSYAIVTIDAEGFVSNPEIVNAWEAK